MENFVDNRIDEVLSRYVEQAAEVPKKEFLSRIAGKVDRSILALVKQTIFYSVTKNKEGHIYFI
ncbi:MAG: hypothetical protein NVS1B13_25220 [Flavisolibacter sp.]